MNDTGNPTFTVICLPASEKEAEYDDNERRTLVDLFSYSEPFEHAVAYIDDSYVKNESVLRDAIRKMRKSTLMHAMKWLHEGFPGSTFRIPIRMCDSPELFSVIRSELNGDDIEVWV